jgi:hypothetical protein
MASINDVNNSVNKVNTTLHKEIDATDDVKTSVDAVKTSVDNLDVDVKAGFAATVAELKNLETIDIAAVKILFHLTQQADTMICALQQISQNTCGILNQVTIQTELQKRLVKDADIIRDIEESLHPGAVLAHHQLAELREQIEKCCPPPVTPPPCVYQPCPSPEPIRPPDLPNPGTPTPSPTQ